MRRRYARRAPKAACRDALRHIDPQADLPVPLQARFQELYDDSAYGADTVGQALGRMSALGQQHPVERVVRRSAHLARYLPTDE